MRIAVDGRYIHDHFPGIGRYTYNLILGLAEVVEQDTIVVIHNPRLPNTRFDTTALGKLEHVEMAATTCAPFTMAEQWVLPRLARQLAVDTWHSPYYISPYRLPCPMVVTVHDAISSRYPQYLPSPAARLSYEVTMRLAMGAARHVVAVSQASRADLIRFFAVPEAKISTIAEAAGLRYRPQPPEVVADVCARLGLPENYVLYLGMNKPHKNVVRLVEAWAQLFADCSDFRSLADFGSLNSLQMVIAGREDPRYPQAWQAVERLGLGPSVRFLGDVAEADLPALYSGATLFVFPSLYEGFGLPVLEAMACAVPVVCSNTPALLEVAGDAALSVDPLDVKELAQAIMRVVADPALRSDLSRRSLKQASLFSWQRTARETLEVYHEDRPYL